MTKNQSLELKGIAIIFMLILHLFNTYEYDSIYIPFFLINNLPFTFYLSLFTENCVAIFLFLSGYGLYYQWSGDRSYRKGTYRTKTLIRIRELYSNYWVVLFLFVFVLGSILTKTWYPGGITSVLLNVTALDTDYNGAWWFLTAYIMLALSSNVIFRFINRYDFNVIVIIGFVIYTLGYIQRFKHIVVFDDLYLSWFINTIALYGNSLLPFLLGAFFVKLGVFYKIESQLNRLNSKLFKRTILISLFVCCFIVKSFLPSLYFAVFTMLITVIVYVLLDVRLKFLQYLGHHSTNIWLIHMFIYMIFDDFKPLVYWSTNPLLILLSLLGVSLFFSYICFAFKSSLELLKLSKFK